MGEVADDMVDGLCCSGCGVYFEKAHGYPVLCHSCYDETPQPYGVQCATEAEL